MVDENGELKKIIEANFPAEREAAGKRAEAKK